MSHSVATASLGARVTAIFGVYAAAGGVLTLLGWILNLPRLTDWGASGISQMPNNALGTLAAGTALIVLSRGHLLAGGVFGALAGTVGAATLLQHIGGIDLGVDRLLIYRDWGQRGTLVPGRMGLPGSTSLALVGVSLVLATFPRTRRLASVGGLLTIGMAALSLLGHMFDADRLFAIPRLTTIAMQTATMMLAIGAGLVTLSPDHQPMKLLLGESSSALLIRRALPGVVLLPLALGWLRMIGEDAGLFDSAFGTVILVWSLIALLAALLWWAAVAVRAHEAEILASRERLAGILGSITDAFMAIDANWRLVFVNEETALRLGTSTTAIVGREFWDVLPGAAENESGRQLRRAMTERISLDYDVFYPQWQRWFSERVYPTGSGGLAVYSRDVTQRKADEEALIESEQKFSLLFEKATFGAALSSLSDGRFADVNEAFATGFGYAKEELIGKTATELGISRDADTRARLLTALSAEGHLRDVELVLHKRDGSPRNFLNNVTTIELRGERYVLTTIQDITERRQAEESLRASAEALRAADRMKDQFLATLSHELRTPLTAIIGWSQMLLGGGLEKREQQIAYETIRASASAQAQLVDDVLDVSRITTGKMRLDREPADLAAVIEQAVATVRPAAEARRIPLQVVLEPGLPPHLIDPERMQQVVWNLLSNAIKFSPPGAAVEVVLRGGDGGVVIEVNDRGRGISPEFLPHVFERFRQADSSPTRAYGGLGIGLALARDITELHGGTIDVASVQGSGSRFTVRLPAPDGDSRGRAA